MKLYPSSDFFLNLLCLVFLAGSPFVWAATTGPKQVELDKKKYACPFICLRFVRSGLHGIIYEGHEPFKLFLVGNVYEDDFEKRVLNKANLSCKGGNSAKLVDFNTQKYMMADGLGQTKEFTKVTTIKTFSPAAHCIEDPGDPSEASK